MSFNVRGSFRDRVKGDAWPNRAAFNVATVDRHAPALVGLQECQRGNLDAYRENLPRYELVKGPRYGNTPPHDFNAVLYDPRLLELLDAGGFWLSKTPGRPSRSWGTRVARSANWCVFRLAATGLRLLHVNTHLDHKSPEARREGSRLIVRRTALILDGRDPGTPVIITGDFNARPGNPAHRNFTEAGFEDTFLTAGNADAGDVGTFHAFRGRNYEDPHPGRGPRRMDWILLKDPSDRLRVLSHAIIRDHDERSGRYPSDHYPVLARFAPSDPA